jgi:hypothetical protein
VPIADLRAKSELPGPEENTMRINRRSFLDQAIEAARTFKPLGAEEIAALLGRTREAATKGQYELYKTTQHFDGTAHHPQWLG